MEENVKVKIKGTSPLLFNKFNPEGEGLKKAAKAQQSAEEEAEQSVYRNAEGQIYTPSSHVLGSMVKSGVQFKMKGRKTFKDAVNSGVLIDPEEIVHKNQEYEIDSRSVVIKSTRGRIMRHRAKLPVGWELSFTIKIIDERLTAPLVKEILENAGKYVGIGDFRPRFGRFDVIEYKKSKKSKK